MPFDRRWPVTLVPGLLISSCLLNACSQTGALTSAADTGSVTRSYGYSGKDKDCMARAMYFESLRSSRDGLVAVGTVVMNRLESKRHGDTVCEVVGEKGQFAPGVLSRPMKPLPDVHEAAEAVLKGERHPEVQNAMYFHQAGRKYPYKNMHYVLVAGGNAFYEKRSRKPKAAPVEQPATAVAAAPDVDTMEVASIRRSEPAQTSQTANGGEATAQPVLSFEASPAAADAIGALILNQDNSHR